MALKRGIVKLEEYNEKWHQEYQEEANLLKKLLGDKIISIDHVGSTSIPGLKSKPIIDILLVIPSLNLIPEIDNILNNYNYHNMGPRGVNDRFFYAKGPDEARTHYLHVTIPNSDTYYSQIYFKRYLIEHPTYIKKYCQLKEELEKKYADERPKYTEGKHEFISNVIKLAKEEYDK